MKWQKRTSIFLPFFLAFYLTSCGKASMKMMMEGNQIQNDIPGQSAKIDDEDKRTEDPVVVCDPFAKENIVDPLAGIKAELRFLEPAERDQMTALLDRKSAAENGTGPVLTAEEAAEIEQKSKISYYLENGTLSSAEIFFNRIHLPTIPFDAGFSDGNGAFLTDEAGNKLTEYFSLSMSSSIKLPETYDEGDYEFVIISDDGTKLDFISSTGERIPYLDNDGMHPPLLGCPWTPESLANLNNENPKEFKSINLQHDRPVHFKLDYYQGPKRHISMMMFWRKRGTGEYNLLAQQLCNKYDMEIPGPDETLLDLSWADWFTDTGEGGELYNQLTSLGFEPVPAEAYQLSEGFNRCSRPATGDRP